MPYLPFVDGLRAVAIAAVVAFHAVPAVMPGGFAGVDVFFVISGFLITRFIAAEIAGGTFSLTAFFVRRARRLLPASLVCFAIVTGLAALVLLPDAFLDYGRSLISSVLMYANYYFFKTSGYFSAPSLEKPLLHTWSLAVEDQYYLTWPLLLMLAMPRLSRTTLLVVTAGLAVASLVLAEIMLPRHPDFVFYLLPTRAWELLLGALLALIADRIRIAPFAAEALGVIGLGAIGASFAMLSAGDTFPGLSAVPACLGTGAVIASGLAHGTAVARVLSFSPIVLLGLISYSLYLWHWPLLALLSYRLERPLGAEEALAVVAISMVIAYLSWRFVERPFRAGRNAIAGHALIANDRRFITVGVAGVAVLALAGGAVSVFKGVPQRFGDAVRPMLEHMVSGNPLRRSCDNFENIFGNDAICNFGRMKSPGDSYEVAVFGDSMADHWVPLAESFAQARGYAARQVTNGGCALFFGIEIPEPSAAKALECASYQSEAQKFLDANRGLKLAVVSAYWSKWMARVDAMPPSISPPGSEAASLFDSVLAATLGEFTKRGIKVLLIGQIPTYQRLPVRCIVAALRDGSDTSPCGLTANDAEREVGASNASLNRLAAANPAISVFLPSSVMCQSERCPPMLAGVMLYKNEGHVNRFGAEYLGRFVKFPTLEARGNGKP
jgi:peptidoglycan/LPS O-acetylase OafA/YrhL